MTATCLPLRRSNGAGWMLALILMLVAGVLLAATVQVNHADQKHGAEAALVRACKQRNGVIQTWQKPDGRLIDICSVAGGKYGLHIYALDDNGVAREITAFIKNKLRTFDDVCHYLSNCGAKPLP